MNYVDVVAAFIAKNNTFMICQRPANKARGLLWEFVGGKVEEGESKEQALVRECMEELGVAVTPKEVFFQTTHKYPDISISLTLFFAEIVDGEPQCIEHNDIRWIRTDEIENFDFCPADTQILEHIIKVFKGDQ